MASLPVSAEKELAELLLLLVRPCLQGQKHSGPTPRQGIAMALLSRPSSWATFSKPPNPALALQMGWKEGPGQILALERLIIYK